MHPLLTAFTCTTLSLSLALGSSVAFAAPAGEGEGAPAEGQPEVSDAARSEGEKLSEEAIAKFQAKDYDGAIELFERAYELDPQPNYLFNIGRVHEEAGNLEAAVKYYAKFVKQPGVDLDSRGVALERLKVLREIVQETGEPDEPEPDASESDDSESDEPQDQLEPAEPPPPVDDGAAKKRKAMRGAGFGLLGVGAAALIAGGVVGGLAQADNNNAGSAATPNESQDLLDSSQTKALAADVMFGVGGALVLTGVILVAVGFKKPKTSERVAFTPTFGPRGAGASLRLRF